MTRSAHTPVPVFKLYGETAAWPTPDLIHWESIESRSRLHEWEIKPHQHGDLVQVLYVRSGRAELEVEGQVSRIERAALQVVPALCVHGFRFSDDVDGHVLTLAQPLVEQVAGLLDSQALLAPACFAAGDSQPYLDTLFEAISREYAQQAPGRELMLQSLISVLLVWIGRCSLEQSRSEAQQQDRGRLHLHAFTQQLEQHFREHLPIEQYAQRLGISAAHLNALCRRLAGQSALQMINQRLLLEAKRCLVYTAMTINQVSDSLGFSEPAYFSRFFKRGTGQSPKAFRISR
ncbi:helix-turn-helix domain-containing protein [Pseudomonas sp. TCU-HL1]|uniref:helix-turn-helix domain-containing protein n=1 Tax=Pseudomonas sp. TCU-HL1 TaxID=1856685 RepID=UPI00083E0108|nr:helix-turn-helix domain-containing protein [Pseudomonas sp. TCU-HL1]AOE85424.1 AraC family transcriptional regulator [Pseudomonas sp. TCU-HL1]